VKTVLTHETGMKGRHERFDKHSHVFFNHGKNRPIKQNMWFIYPCVYFGFNNHCMVNYWKRQSLQENLSRKEAHGKSCSPKPQNDHKGFKFQDMSNDSCVHCGQRPHKIEKCWKLYPQFRSTQN
jgi:hypothetical protein